MKKIFVESALRIVAYVFWLVGVWHHAHWTIALMLTAAMMRFEGEDVLCALERLRKREAVELLTALRERVKEQ